jgi:hypothetical protein
MLTLIPESGSPQITTFHSVFRRLPRHVNVAHILAKLGRFNHATVTLADGNRVRLELTADEAAQPELALPATYHANCKILLGLGVDVQCTARDEVEATHLIEDVFRGERMPPGGFCPVFDEDEVKVFMQRLRRMFETGNIFQMGVQDVMVTSFADPPKQLEYRT